jgi:Putative peptidoglycan binding domain
MASPVLKFGDKGVHVEELQRLLNKRVKQAHRSAYFGDIPITGEFHNHTRHFVDRFQSYARLETDKIVGPMTWAALRDTELYNCFDEPASPVPAADDYTCWAAGTAMLKKETRPNTTRFPDVTFETQPNGKVGGLGNLDANMVKFARHHNFGSVVGKPITSQALCGLVKMFGRLMVNIKGVTSSLTPGTTNDSHLLVLAGVRGDGTPNGTTLTLYNTSPGGGSPLIVTSFSYMKSRFPHFIFQCFYSHSNRSSKLY